MDCRKCLNCGLFFENTGAKCPVCGSARYEQSSCPLPMPYSVSTALRYTAKGKQVYTDACKCKGAAMIEYGQMLAAGTEGVSRSAREAYDWYQAATRYHGGADGYYWMGLMLNNRELTWRSVPTSGDDAIPLLRQGAELGSVRCMGFLGALYLGNGTARARDDGLAYKYLSDAAARGDKGSMVLMAQCHLDGSHGFEHNAARAKELYERSGMLYRMYGDFRRAYSTGRGLPCDPAKAREMGEKYLEELKRMHRTAPREIATYGYACLIGDEYLSRGDTQSAAAWYRTAMNGGDIMGSIKLRNLNLL